MIHKDCRYFEGTGNFCSRVTAMRCDEFPECEFKYIYFLQKDIKMLKDTLQEIKEIADARCNKCKYGKDGISCKYGDCGEAKLHLIVQLITKAEEE